MTAPLAIAEVARRSGFSPPTLRYYEQLGLLVPPDRTPSGYRAYDESVLARLAFIARAKALGCSLEEIAELLPDWDAGQCAPLQDRLRTLAASKLEETRARMDELVAFAGDLGRIRASLGAHTPAGRCDDECGCLGEPASIACTLDGEQVSGRVQEWKDLLAHVTARQAQEGGVRLELDQATPLGELVRLVDAERSCCGFFAFTVSFDAGGTALEVRAPAAAEEIVEALFGPA